MKIGKFRIKAARWPWQTGYDWKGMKSGAPLNSQGARFGGGWKYRIGIDVGASGTVCLNLLFGMIRIWRED